MTEKEFLNCLAHGQEDLPGHFLEILSESSADHCVIDGLETRQAA